MIISSLQSECISADRADVLALHVVIIALSFGRDCQLLGMHCFALYSMYIFM